MSSLLVETCPICKQLLNINDRKQVISECNHTFHQTCTENLVNKYPIVGCPVCKKELGSFKVVDERQIRASTAALRRSRTQDKTRKDTARMKSALSALPNRMNVNLKDGNNTNRTHENEGQYATHSIYKERSRKQPISSDDIQVAPLALPSRKTPLTCVTRNVDTLASYKKDNQMPHLSNLEVKGKDNKYERHMMPEAARASIYLQQNNEANEVVRKCELCNNTNDSNTAVCTTCQREGRLENRCPNPASVFQPTSSRRTDATFERNNRVNPEQNIVPRRQFPTDKLPLPQIVSTTSTVSNNEKTCTETLNTATTIDTNKCTTDIKSSNEHVQTAKPLSTSASSSKEVFVYICCSFISIEDDNEIEKLVRRRLEDVFQIKPIDVKYYLTLGAGIISVTDDTIKDRLTEIGSFLLDPTEKNSMVSFHSIIEFVSYIVLDVIGREKDSSIPEPNEIRHQWVQLYKTDTPLSCVRLDEQFPNIYCLKSTSLSELIRISSNQHFTFKKMFGQVYFCADCHFLEDLPRSITQDQLKEAIISDMKQPNIVPTSLYVQINKQTANACIITSDMARKWRTDQLNLNGKLVMKTKNLSYYLVIHPVPQTFVIEPIIKHQLFRGKATKHKHIGDELMLKLSDKNIFNECVNCGRLSIDNATFFHMETYNNLNALEGHELDAYTWYETEMLRYDADIKQFIDNPEHVVFVYKWNSQIWLEQLKRATLHNAQEHYKPIIIDQKSISADKLCSLLRLTVILNTLGTIRRGNYVVGDHVVKFNVNDNLETIVYDHKSKLAKGGKMPLNNIPYSHTYIHVVKEDSLIIYEQLIKQGERPLLLIMTNTMNPNDSYQKDDKGQEADLFRRSNYCGNLGIGLNDFIQQKARRVHCSSSGQLNSLSVYSSMYPMDEYGAIYTSGITVFRQPENKGYAYMEKPLENVCSLTTAPYQNFEFEERMPVPKHVVRMRKKIENMFAIAYHHKHDCLILSISGCDTYQNSMNHIARLFRSVIDQYAGFFKSIRFTIVDDHNACYQSSLDSNLKSFAEMLNERTVQPMPLVNKPNIIFGPYLLLSDGVTVSDVCIFNQRLCNFGAQCKNIYNPIHKCEYSHPPICREAVINTQCSSIDDIIHMISSIHRKHCQYGGECDQINDNGHIQEFEHPPYCSQAGNCQDMEEQHLKQFCHLPLCKQFHKCMDYTNHNQAHCNAYRHCKPCCPDSNYCSNFHDKVHISEFQHPFPTPCLRSPFHCPFYITLSETADTSKLSNEVRQHCLDFGHVCRFGRNCNDTTQLHRQKCIHIARCLCPCGENCTKIHEEDHLNSFTHPSIPDIRLLCKHGEKCYDRQDTQHIKRFRHSITYEGTGIVRYDGLNKNIDFVQNQVNNIIRISNYVNREKWKVEPSESTWHKICNWLRHVQPVHRCNPVILESILCHGHVMSREYMDLLKKPECVANSVFQHSRIQRITNIKIKGIEEHVKEYITALVSAEYEKYRSQHPSVVSREAPTLSLQSSHGESSNYITTIEKKEKILSATISSNDINAIKMKAIEISKASIELHSNPAGIGYSNDKLLETDKHIFSILGPHLGHYYGDIFIIFKREILHHPDTDLSIQAATSFASGNCYKWRPWLVTNTGIPDERIRLYHTSKLSASVPGYDYALALELIALTSLHFGTNSMDINYEAIWRRWFSVDSHQHIEAHLPQLIPLDYIDHIYIPQSIYNSLNNDTHRAINAVFKDRINITPHTCEIDIPKHIFGPIPPTENRANYQAFVISQLVNRFEQNAAQPTSKFIQGTVITIPSTSLIDHYVIPLTISQAYEQYRTSHLSSLSSASSIDTIYIYWQTIKGDMMLTLANEQIDSHKQQPNLNCLICYVAPICVSTDTHYHEDTSYLNSGLPFKHPVFVNENRYAAKSNTFYVGCNTDDFMTLCLEIQYSTNQATLSHAGPNSIYNHEKISCTFKKTELDLTKLKVIHISAGAKTIPIRNLMIYFEKQNNLHPTHDKEFKQRISTLPTVSNSTVVNQNNGDHIHSKVSTTTNVTNSTPGKQDFGKSSMSISEGRANSQRTHLSRYQPTHCPHGVHCCNNDRKHRAKFLHPKS